MNEFKSRVDGTVLNENQIRESFSGMLPSQLTDVEFDILQVDPIFKSPVPSVNLGQYLTRNGETQGQDGKWYENWQVNEYDNDAKAAMLEKLKVLKRQEINEARLAANFTSFTFNGKEIACDTLSRSDIDGTNNAVLATGSLPAGFPLKWKAIDNTYVDIPNVDTWKQFYLAMYYTGLNNFAKSQTLKAQVESATLSNINSIKW